MDEAYRIRVAGVEDLESVFALDREIAHLPHWRFADYLAALPSVNQEAGGGDTSRCLFVAESASAVVGFAVGKVAVVELDVTAELESVGVARRVRRSGVGKALCMAVIKWSRKMDAKRIQLEVRSQSVGPIALYEGLGFVDEGRRRNYYRDPIDDAILMRLDLASYRC